MPGLLFQPQNNFFNSQLQTQASFQSPRAAGLITNGGTCDDRLGQLVGDIFIGHEVSIVIPILQISMDRSIISVTRISSQDENFNFCYFR